MSQLAAMPSPLEFAISVCKFGGSSALHTIKTTHRTEHSSCTDVRWMRGVRL
jgi:hypothetical protein